MSSYEISINFSQRITGARHISLSSMNLTARPPKDVLEAKESGPNIAKWSAQQHLAEIARNAPGQWDGPSLVISVRNILSNRRCIALVEGQPTPWTLKGEDLEARPYHALGWNARTARLEVVEWSPQSATACDYTWLFTGVPTRWDDETGDLLLARMATEAADPAHVWHLPRGNHPQATNTSRTAFAQMEQAFVQSVSSDRLDAVDRLLAQARKMRLTRERGYLHHVVGVDPEGHLCHLIGRGKLEALGGRLQRLYGVERSLCVDNGDGIEVCYFRSGAGGPWSQTVSSPQFRTGGSAYLCIALDNMLYKLTN